MVDNNHTSVKHLVETGLPFSGSVERAERISQRPPQTEASGSVENAPLREVSPISEISQDKIDLPQELVDAGVKTVDEATFPSVGEINLPLSDDKIESGQHAPISSSIKWLSKLCIYILKQAGQGLKKIHGKVVRIELK